MRRPVLQIATLSQQQSTLGKFLSVEGIWGFSFLGFYQFPGLPLLFSALYRGISLLPEPSHNRDQFLLLCNASSLQTFTLILEFCRSQFAIRAHRDRPLSDLPTTAAGTVGRLYSNDISRHQPAGSAFVVPCTWNSTMEDDFDEWFCGGDGGDDFVDDGYDFTDSLASFSVTEEVTIAAWDAVDTKWDEVPRSYAPAWRTFIALRAVLFQIQDIVQGHIGEIDLSQLPGHVTKFINAVSRFIRKYDSSACGYYGLGHILDILFPEIIPKTIGSKAAEIRVTRAARDALFAVYESICENLELMDTFPAKNKPDINFLPSPNASMPARNPHSPTQVSAAHSQPHPKRAYGQAHSPGGDANTTTEIGTGLEFVDP